VLTFYSLWGFEERYEVCKFCTITQYSTTAVLNSNYRTRVADLVNVLEKGSSPCNNVCRSGLKCNVCKTFIVFAESSSFLGKIRKYTYLFFTDKTCICFYNGNEHSTTTVLTHISVRVQGKGELHPRTGYVGPEEE
jgi:hypothetical protein